MKSKITVDNVEYIRADSAQRTKAKELDGLEYCIVRTYSAGVFAGYLKERNGKEGVVLRARRLWYWKGASSLSELAMKGVAYPNECKFPCEVDSVILTEIIEVIPCTEDARQSILNVPEWKQID